MISWGLSSPLLRTTLCTATLIRCIPTGRSSSLPWRRGNGTCSILSRPYFSMLSATPGAPGQINVLWTDKSDNDAGFLIYRKTGKCNDPGAWNSQAMNPANDVTYPDTALVSGTTYSYRVRAFTRSAELPYSYAYSLLSSCAEMTAP